MYIPPPRQTNGFNAANKGVIGRAVAVPENPGD
jgi:hypothetical protein